MATENGTDIPMLNGRRIVLGVTGGIAAYKAALLVRLLRKAGAEVQVLMTSDAARFITPLTLGTLSGKDVLVDVFPEDSTGGWTRHIELGLWADLLVVAPTTAKTLATMAAGSVDSMLTATVLAARCPILVCPAMDHDMYIHPATKNNIEILRSYGYEILEPEHGELASGLIGEGRLPEPETILDRVAEMVGVDRTLSGQRVVVSAGPTQEAIDPVRYITNHSSGRMGYALAEAAARRGAHVTLVAGPTALPDPRGVDVVHVVSTADMKDAVDEAAEDAEIVIMAGAVSDYTPAKTSDSKIKKSARDLSIKMTRTDDILMGLGKRKTKDQYLVGFALETDDTMKNARRKLKEKNCDLIVLNNAREEGAGFGTETNVVTLISKSGTEKSLPLMSKANVAEEILNHILADRDLR